MPVPFPDIYEIAWIAGVFEGEGAITLDAGRYVAVVINMCDRDVLERIDRVFPSANGVRSRGPLPEGYRPQFVWKVGARADVRRFLEAVLPWLGERRARRAKEMLALIATLPTERGGYNGNKTHCVRGHPFDQRNTYVYRGIRHCRACRRAADARHYARRRGQQ